MYILCFLKSDLEIDVPKNFSFVFGISQIWIQKLFSVIKTFKSNQKNTCSLVKKGHNNCLENIDDSVFLVDGIGYPKTPLKKVELWKIAQNIQTSFKCDFFFAFRVRIRHILKFRLVAFPNSFALPTNCRFFVTSFVYKLAAFL